MLHFGTNGIRGRFEDLTPELALKIGRGIGLFFQRGEVLVARDGRITGDAITNAVISGLTSAGANVFYLGIVPSPTAEHYLRKRKKDGLVIVTASHNPPEWNAIKVVDKKGVSVSKERAKEIENLMNERPTNWRSAGRVYSTKDSIHEHIKAILSFVGKPKKKLKIVLGCGNGTSGLLAPRMLEELGHEIIPVNANIDGRFPGRPSEPREDTLKFMKEVLLESGADIGFAWDGDSDRVVMLDEKGNFIVGDKVLALCTYWRLKERKGDVVTTVATSRLIEDIAKENDRKVIYTKIGAPYLSEEMAKGDYAIGGEEVGGVIFPEISLAKDGFLAAAYISTRLKEDISKVLSMFPKYYNTKMRINCPDEKKERVIKEIAKESENKDTIKIDGIRINLDNSWVIIRASGTEPIIRVFAEARSLEESKRLAKSYAKRVREIIK